MGIDYNALYSENVDFKRYVDRYCNKHRCPVEVALTHYLVRMAGRQYQEGKQADLDHD